MRLWLAGAFAAVTLITAGVVYLFGDRPRAVLGAVALGVLAGFLIAVGDLPPGRRASRAPPARWPRAPSTRRWTTGGRDEIGDLARALDSMRASLKESFGVLTADRNKLEAIFDGLTDAVMVVDYDGAAALLQQRRGEAARPAGRPPEAMLPQLQPRRRGRLRRPPGAADRRPRLRDERPLAARRARRPRRRPRPHRRDAPRARRSRLRLQRRPRAAQPAGRDLRRDRGPAGAAPRTTPRRATTSSAASPRTPSG